MGNVLDASVIDEVTDALQIETPNGKTVSRLTLNDLPVLSADAAVFAGGSAMVAVDDHFVLLKNQISDSDPSSTAFANMGQLSVIQQSHFSVGQLDGYDELFAMSAVLARRLAAPPPQALIACTLYNLTVMDKKNRDYGSNNISEYGEMGVLVRMRDKYHRAVRLQSTGGVSAVMDESLFDTWGDMANYSRIGQAISLNLWKNN